MRSLIALASRRLPFDPPAPPPLSKAELAGALVAVAAFAVVDQLTGGIISGLGSLPGSSLFAGAQAALPDPGTGPAKNRNGDVECTRCRAFVPWSTMFLDEHGYFCSPCADAIIAASLRA